MSPVVRTRIYHRIYLSAFGAAYEDIGAYTGGRSPVRLLRSPRTYVGLIPGGFGSEYLLIHAVEMTSLVHGMIS